MREFPPWLTTTLASDATQGQGILPNTILPLRPTSHIVGPARVVVVSQDDNLLASHKNGPALLGGTVSFGGTIIRFLSKMHTF